MQIKSGSAKTKVIFACSIGTFLEFYDLSLYGFFALSFAKQFFPTKSDFISVLLSYGTFALSFLARPFGALVIGRISDRRGRKEALCLSLMVMSLSTLCIGLIPEYNAIGIASPLILMVLRFLQGISVGGEYNNAFLYVFEEVKVKHGILGGLMTSTAVLGTLFASIVSSLISYLGDTDTWRYAYFIGGLLGIGGLLFRRYLPESDSNPEKNSKISLLISKEAFLIFIIGALSGALFYTQFIFFKGLMISQLHIKDNIAALIINIFLVVYLMMLIFMGRVADRYGCLKLMRYSSICGSLLIIPLFALIDLQVTTAFLVLFPVILCIVTSSFVAPSHSFMREVSPHASKGMFVSFYFSLGMSIAGGTAPAILHALASYTGSSFVCGFLFVGLCSLFLVVSQTTKSQGLLNNDSNAFTSIKNNVFGKVYPLNVSTLLNKKVKLGGHPVQNRNIEEMHKVG